MKRCELLIGKNLLTAFGARSVSAVVNDVLSPKGVPSKYRGLFNDSKIDYRRMRIRELDTAEQVVVERDTKPKVRSPFCAG